MYICIKDKNVMKELFLLRGVPGCGKSTLAKSLVSGVDAVYYEADDYFMVGGEYKFDASKLPTAHKICQAKAEAAMDLDERLAFPKIVVSNTFTQEWEMKPYYEMAEKYGYRVYSLIVENRHEGVNEHGVPADKLEQMKTRFDIKL